MKIIAVNGSPRKECNTAALLNKAIEGAASQGAKTELINLYDLDYTGCVSCFACKKKGGERGKCAVHDELSPVIEKIKTADAVIFGSPIYFMNITSGMAAFLERLLFSNMIYSFEIPTVFPTKIRSAFIYTMGMDEKRMEESGIKNSLKFYENAIGRILGNMPEVLYSSDTYQFTDYSKYESSMFSEQAKAKHKAEQFPIDCEKAFNIGSALITAKS